MDISLPGINGIEAARRILKSMPNAKIVFLTQESSPEIVEETILLGARGYVFKSHAQSDLLLAVEAVLRGKQFFNRKTSGPKSDGNGEGR
jgi:DNA-binding NarL/FixJ family response regulator